MKRIIIIILLILISYNFSFSQKIDKGYHIYQSEKLERSINGIDGYLQILQDDRLTTDEIRDNSSVDGGEYLNSIFQIVDLNGKILLMEKIEYPVTDLEKVYLYGDIKPTYLIKISNWAGMGRETGHLTFFVEIENGEMKYVVTKDGLQSSLGSGWIIDDYKKEKNKQIFYVESHYGSDPMELILKRYYFDGKDWNFKSKIIYDDWWEIGEKEFPSIDLFP